MSSCALGVLYGKPLRFPVFPACMQAALVAMVDESERLKHEQEKIMVRVRPLVLCLFAEADLQYICGYFYSYHSSS